MKRILIMETGSFKVIGGAAKDTLKMYKKLSSNPDYEVDILGDYSKIDNSVEAIDKEKMIEKDYDVIMLNSVRDIPLAARYLKIHKNVRTKFVYVDRGNVILNFKKAGIKKLLPKMLIREHLMRSMRKWLDFYIAISIDQMQYAKFFFTGRTKVEYIMIAPHEEFRVLGTKKTYAGGLTVARLDERQKRISFMIKGIEKLKERYPDIRDAEVLRIVGTGIDEQKYKQLSISLGLDKNITFEGFKSGQELVKVYNNAGFFVSTSKWEGLGRSLLEAMACGLPLLINENINTTINENPRATLVRDLDNGIIYKAEDIDDFAEKFYWLYSDKKVQEKLSSKTVEFMKQFSFESVMKKYEDIIESQ